MAILVALSLSGVIGAGKISMSKGTYTIIKMIKGEFDVPVGERTSDQRKAIVRFLRNQESYQLNEDGVLLCNGKLVITQSEIKNVIRTEFHQSKGKGPRKCGFAWVKNIRELVKDEFGMSWTDRGDIRY